MAHGNAYKQYNRSSIETAGKLNLVIMCYEKAILCLNQAENHFYKKEFEKKAKKIQKALDIINELQSCLNFEKGEAIAKNLDSIYTYLTTRILMGDIKKDASAFNECAKILVELKGAWEGISHSHSEERVTNIASHNTEYREGVVIAA